MRYFKMGCIIAGVLAIGFLGMGCEPNAANPKAEITKLPQQWDTTVSESIAAMDAPAWMGVESVEADVLLHVQPVGAAGYINQFQMRWWPGYYGAGGQLRASSRAAGKDLFVRVTRGEALQPLDKEATPQQACEIAFTMLLRRLGGPMNLAMPSVQPKGKQEVVHLPGGDVVRVGVQGEGMRKAYYFDRTTHLLKYVTVGADRPGEKGTVTLYEYTKIDGTYWFPSSVRVVLIGEHVLISDREVWSATIANVKVLKGKS
jgi:hypothetical protein